MSASLALAPAPRQVCGPFSLDDAQGYARWRERKLQGYPSRVEDLIVEVRDPMSLSRAEYQALAGALRRANMVIYACGRSDEDKQIARAIGGRFGLARLDRHWLADEDAIARIEVRDGQSHGEMIPYSDRPISWHTDGYYNPPERQIRSVILHCVRPAGEGGVNAMLDHEIAYLALRDQGSDFIRALSMPDAMTIPPRLDERQQARGEQAGPVFSTDAAGRRLYMRYTARTRSIRWREDRETGEAVARLERILAESPYVLKLRLEAGMGFLSANVLHARSGFADDPLRPRLMFRARYYDDLDLDNDDANGDD